MRLTGISKLFCLLLAISMIGGHSICQLTFVLDITGVQSGRNVATHALLRDGELVAESISKGFVVGVIMEAEVERLLL
jgi:hypothetical protein